MAHGSGVREEEEFPFGEWRKFPQSILVFKFKDYNFWLHLKNRIWIAYLKSAQSSVLFCLIHIWVWVGLLPNPSYLTWSSSTFSEPTRQPNQADMTWVEYLNLFNNLINKLIELGPRVKSNQPLSQPFLVQPQNSEARSHCCDETGTLHYSLEGDFDRPGCWKNIVQIDPLFLSTKSVTNRCKFNLTNAAYSFPIFPIFKTLPREILS